MLTYNKYIMQANKDSSHIQVRSFYFTNTLVIDFRALAILKMVSTSIMKEESTVRKVRMRYSEAY
jgi:hypothetical protein